MYGGTGSAGARFDVITDTGCPTEDNEAEDERDLLAVVFNEVLDCGIDSNCKVEFCELESNLTPGNSIGRLLAINHSLFVSMG